MSNAAAAPREPLTARRVIAGAVELADRIGVDAVTIRRLADHLGVRPMSIYHHVAGKEAIVDGMVEAVFDEIERPPAGLPWRDAIRHRSRSARAALRRHPWAPPLMESRVHPGAGILDHHEAVLAVWFGAGFPLGLVAHANAVVDAFVYGFALQEAALPFGEHEGRLSDEAAEIVVPLVPDRYPHLIRFAREHALQPDYDFGRSFEFGLDVVLDGLERALAATREP